MDLLFYICAKLTDKMTYCIDPTIDEPIMLLNKHIGYDEEEGMGIDGDLFQRELLMLDSLGKKRIQVWINSVGGSVMEGYSIYSTILKTSTPVDTYAVGGVASISAVIFQAGRKRIMTDYAWLMYHNPFGADNKELIETMRSSIVKMIEQRSGMTDGEISAMMNRTSFITAAEAIMLKLCDTIEESKFENTKYLKKISAASNFNHECNKVLNSILNNNQKNQKMTEMKLVTNRLKLNDAATEDSIVKAIDAIENRAKTAEQNLQAEILKAQDKAAADKSEVDKLKDALKKAEAEKEKADKAYNECKSMLDAMEADKRKAEEDAKADKAKNMIEGFAKIGRIKNDATTILKWTNTALSLGLDEVKDMIEALPLNRKADEITHATPNQLGEGELPTTAMGLAVKNKLKREGKI